MKKMAMENLPSVAIDSFLYYFKQLCDSDCGTISEQRIDPVQPADLENLESIERSNLDIHKALSQTVVLKLNGGLGTTMGLDKAKSLISVKNSCSFLDITALQIRNLNRTFGVTIPLILMNSFKTEKDSSAVLSNYPDLKTVFPFSFLQNKFPKIIQKTLEPACCVQNPSLEWNPPGHGDIYSTLFTTGILEKLLEHNYKYAFVSNIDNLGAALDTNVLGYFASKGFSFLMEVTDRTHMDRKGGHLAKTKDGRFVLRESAQCSEKDRTAFTDITLHRYFNTNNLWIDLGSLYDTLNQNDNQLRLPLIINTKHLDPKHRSSPSVYQLESAMGSAISVFNNSSALRVPRTRFSPVKSCEDLLLLWSDYYVLTDDYHIVVNPARKEGSIDISLDPQYYGHIDQLQDRFPHGAPSLINCKALCIQGDVRFGKNVTIADSVTIVNDSSAVAFIDDSSHIDSDITL